MAPKTAWYDEQAAKAPWRGTVDGKEAYIDRFKGRWEVCCRVTKGGDGVIMFTLTNKEAIRRLASKAAPSIPEDVRKKLMKAAKRDVPVKAPRRPVGRIAAIVVGVLVVAAAAAVMMFPGLVQSVRQALPW
jgi:hypothetical protein